MLLCTGAPLATLAAPDGSVRKPLPPYERPPHTSSSLLQRVGLRALHGHAALRSGRRMLPAEGLARHVTHQQTARGHQFAVYCVSFDKAGRYLATGSDDMFVKVRRLPTLLPFANPTKVIQIIHQAHCSTASRLQGSHCVSGPPRAASATTFVMLSRPNCVVVRIDAPRRRRRSGRPQQACCCARAAATRPK